MARNTHAGCSQCKTRWARRDLVPIAWIFLALAACGESSSGDNAGGSGPGTDLPDVRDAASTGSIPDVIDDTAERDDRANEDVPESGMADSSTNDANTRDANIRDANTSDANTSDANDDGAKDGSIADTSSDGAGTADGAEGSSTMDTNGPPVFDVGACVPTVITPRRLTPALYLMLEASGSMDTVDMQQTLSRWGALGAAMPIFVDDAANAGWFVGLDFFPESVSSTVSCIPSDYLAPQVEMGALGGTSNPQGAAITAAIAARSRIAGSPTVPALTAALQHARDWSNSQAQLQPPIDVVFLTDGLPTGCTSSNNTLSGAVSAANTAYLGTPSVRTHVIGVGPTPDANLNQIAAAGGTSQAVYVTESTGAAMAAGLQTVRDQAETCDLAIEGVMDLSLVNFEIRDADGGTTRLAKADAAAGCGTRNGWYYGNAVQPKSATLCPTPCASLKAGASVSLLVGCKSVILPP